MNKLSELFRGFAELINVKSIEAMGIKFFAATAIVLAAFGFRGCCSEVLIADLDKIAMNDEATICAYKIHCPVPSSGAWRSDLPCTSWGSICPSLFTTGGLFAVALAFAMKNIAENYISGMLLRFERIIKPGDVLETEGAMVRVKSIGLRSTIVRSKYEKDLVIPNSELVQERVTNYTYRDVLCRIMTMVGVAYSSDLMKVRKILEHTCDQLEWKSDQHDPEVLLVEFGSSSVNYKISVWIEDPWESGPAKSHLNEAIWWALQKADIVMAYPQLDVHFDEAYKI